MNNIHEENINQTSETKAFPIITYKFYSSFKIPPWLTGQDVYHPNPNITDDYFNFTQLPPKHQFDFIDLFTARIITNSDNYRYWKIEKYINNQLEEKYYFYTAGVEKWIKNGYELNLKIDFYMTYTRDVVNSLSVIHTPMKFNRLTLTNDMINDNPEYRENLLKCLSNVEDILLNTGDTYKSVESIPVLSIDSDGVSSNLFPNFHGERMTQSNNMKQLNMFDVNSYFIPRGKNSFTPAGLTDSNTYGAIQVREGNTDKLYVSKPYAIGVSVAQSWALTTKDEKEYHKIVNKYIILDSLKNENPSDDITDIDEKMKHSYFAVFRNGQGTVDCFPILGKMVGKFYLPLFNITGPKPGADSVNKVGNYANRMYCNYRNNHFTQTLHNDWESIYNDYVKNFPPGYTVNSFIGIYKGMLPTGDKSKLSWVLEENINTASVTVNGNTFDAYFPKIKRMMYQLSYDEFMEITISDYDKTNNVSKKFDLFKTNNLVDNYINLLEPYQIGQYEIIPARYIFLADEQGKFEIKKTMMFLDSFYLFLNNALYNNPTYIVNLGGTLPSSTERYQAELDVINQQKNNGIAQFALGAVGKAASIIPGIGQTFAAGLNYQKAQGEYNVTQNMLKSLSSDGLSLRGGLAARDLYFTRTNLASTGFGLLSSGISAGVGLIGDSLNFSNFLRMNEFQKRNLGIGYITTNTDDLLSAVINQNNINNDKTSWVTRGIFSVIYKKKFTDVTIKKYKYYFHMFGFAINDLLPASYVDKIIKLTDKNSDNVGYFSLDADWVRASLIQAYSYVDDRIKEGIIQHLTAGIRLKKFH